MNLPSHKNPIDQNGNLIPARTACAPYNFVPLPDAVVPAVNDPENDLPDQDRFHADRKTGYFEVELEVKSPLYVRCALPQFVRLEDWGSRAKRSRSHKNPSLPAQQGVDVLLPAPYLLEKCNPSIEVES